jgi:gas vesicle protein
MAPHLDAEQRQIMRRSSEALAEKIREKFSNLLKEQDDLQQKILAEDDLLKHITP